MRTLALAIVVTVLTFSASGVSTFMVAEPCAAYEEAGCTEASCPPTCATCGCCAQAVELLPLSIVTSLEIPVLENHTLISRLPKTAPHDILHVPKPLGA